MSINPVSPIGPGEALVGEATRPAPSSGTAKSMPNPGNTPAPEVPIPQRAADSLEMPQDEVQVQRDNQVNGEIIIKYLDHFGNVILQVPSSEVLGMVRAIDQDFQQKAKAESKAGTAQLASEGDKNNGH